MFERQFVLVFRPNLKAPAYYATVRAPPFIVGRAPDNGKQSLHNLHKLGTSCPTILSTPSDYPKVWDFQIAQRFEC